MEGEEFVRARRFVFFAGRAKGKEKDGGTTESAQPPRCALLVQ